MLEKVSLNGGKYITAGIQLAIGVKDVLIHIPCKPYVQKLRWVSSKFIVLWDVADRRGWLVKGISALLHLIRASLKYYETDAFSTALLSKYDDIQEPSTAFQGDYSIGILLDERNMKLPIYPEKDEVQHEDSGSTLQDPTLKSSDDERSKNSRIIRGSATLLGSICTFRDLKTSFDMCT